MDSNMDFSAALQLIRRGCVEIISEAELKAKLTTGRQLIIKAGFDPTVPDLHLGHTVILRKLRHFQDLGHKVIFLIGDATALVGDPSGQSQTRRLLTWDEVRANAQTYQQQVKKILLTDPRVFEVRYNSEWFLGRSPQRRTEGLETFDFSKWVQLASKYTVAQLVAREDFSTRLKTGKPLSMLELFYPLMQGYDSVKVAEQYGHCDVELGGTDQTFNLLVGRELLKEYGHEAQAVVTMPLLEGTDGVQKMSKSLGNYIGISESPSEMFGKIMSIPDNLILRYFTLLTDVAEDALAHLETQLKNRQINPRDAKADLGEAIVGIYHGDEVAQRSRTEFARVFSQRQVPAEMPVHQVSADASGTYTVRIVDVLVEQGIVKSKNDARRLFDQNAIKLDGKAIHTPLLSLDERPEVVLQIGSHHFLKLLKRPKISSR